MSETTITSLIALVVFAVVIGVLLISEHSNNQVKIAAIQACYAAGHQDCDKVWK